MIGHGNFLRDGIPLGRPFGIPVTANATLLPIALLLMWAFISALPYGWLDIPVALLGVVGLYGSILLHELGHALTARAFGIRTRTINLHFFGGVAQILGEPRRPLHEFLIAVAGPAVSLLLAAVLAVACAAAALAGAPESALLVPAWLTGINAILALFNLLPGYPMDGGRVLRSLLWARWNDLRRATAVAARGGVLLGMALVVAGLTGWVFSLPLLSPMTSLLGLFIVGLARAELQRVRQSAARWRPHGQWQSPADLEDGDEIVHRIIRLPDGREVHLRMRRRSSE